MKIEYQHQTHIHINSAEQIKLHHFHPNELQKRREIDRKWGIICFYENENKLYKIFFFSGGGGGMDVVTGCIVNLIHLIVHFCF